MGAVDGIRLQLERRPNFLAPVFVPGKRGAKGAPHPTTALPYAPRRSSSGSAPGTDDRKP